MQEGPEFVIEQVANLDADAQSLLTLRPDVSASTHILGKDLPLEQTIANMSGLLANLGIKIEIASWRNLIPNVWSLHIRDAHSPMCFTNGKGATKESALASALGEYIERLSNNHFYAGAYWGEDIANAEFVHYPNERWFKPGKKDALPTEILDEYSQNIYNPDGELKASHLVDTNSGNVERGICSLPYIRQSDGETVYFPSNLIENLFFSNGMSAGNTLAEAQVQCLSEIFERAVKREILEGEIALPDVPQEVLAKYPGILAGIQSLEEQGFPVLVKDASLGGIYPVMCVTLMNPRTGGVFASFGAYPSLEVALERSLTELLQGRSLEGLNDLPPPTFASEAVTEPNNFVEHFIDSSGIVSWRFFSATLIGIEFDENTVWGQLTVLELKLLIHLALKQFEEAHELVGAFLQYNDNTVERKLFYQALDAALEVHLDDELEMSDYQSNFRRMYGDARMDAVLGSIDGSVRFYDLTPTSMKLEGLDRHHRLIDSYRKLHKARASGAKPK